MRLKDGFNFLTTTWVRKKSGVKLRENLCGCLNHRRIPEVFVFSGAEKKHPRKKYAGAK